MDFFNEPMYTSMIVCVCVCVCVCMRNKDEGKERYERKEREGISDQLKSVI